MPDWLGVAPISDLLPAEHEHLRRQIRFELDTYVNAEPDIGYPVEAKAGPWDERSIKVRLRSK